jgi:type IV secretory pathway VirB2 component (pilin)
MFSLLFVNGDWKKAIQIVTYIYMVLIFAEIIPVVRRGLPFNLLNP